MDIRDMNLEGAYLEYANGFSVICGDGRVKCVTNAPELTGEAS
jgi:hypothetical protein